MACWSKHVEGKISLSTTQRRRCRSSRIKAYDKERGQNPKMWLASEEKDQKLAVADGNGKG